MRRSVASSPTVVMSGDETEKLTIGHGSEREKEEEDDST